MSVRVLNDGFISPRNSSNVALAGGAIFTGGWDETDGFLSTLIAVKSDVAGTVVVQFSPDASNVDSSSTFVVSAATDLTRKVSNIRKYVRVVYTNGSGAQSYMRLQTTICQLPLLTQPVNTTIEKDATATLVRAIPPEIDIAAGRSSSHEVIDRLGFNAAITTALEDVWSPGGIRTWHTTAQTVEVLSSNVNDTSAGTGARQITIHGLDANWLEVSEVVTMNGTSVVAVTQTFLRVNRMRVTSRGGYSTKNIGTITCRVASGGDTISEIPIDATFGGLGTTQMSHHSVPAGKTAFINHFLVSAESNKPLSIFVLFRTGADDVTAGYSGEFYAKLLLSATTDLAHIDFSYPLKIPEKSDIWVQAYATGATTGFCSVFYQMTLLTT